MLWIVFSYVLVPELVESMFHVFDGRSQHGPSSTKQREQLHSLTASIFFFLAHINAPSLLDVLRVKFINNLSQGSGGLKGWNSFAKAPFGLYIIAYHV